MTDFNAIMPPDLGLRSGLQAYPAFEHWDDVVEFDPKAWPRKQENHFSLIPTVCFNCESGCGLLAYVDKATGEVRKFEGNPLHVGSQGHNCAKGPATINQTHDPQRILYPMRRKGPRGSGQWERVSWPDALADIGGRIRKAFQENRREAVMYHVGRPGHEGYIERVLRAWGVDGYNSHTSVCSASSRLGYMLWSGADRPSPDYGNAEFILLISAHLESGHYFNPHAQRIIDAMNRNGAELAVMDPRLSNTASRANYWLPTLPGSEAAVLLAMARIILRENLANREFLKTWTNWETYLQKKHPDKPVDFDTFMTCLTEDYARFTPEFAAQEAGIDATAIADIARKIAKAGSRFASHVWRAAGAGNEGGWQVARCLAFLNTLVGCIDSKGGTGLNSWVKYSPQVPLDAPAPAAWNELIWPREYPLAHYELSHLLPYLLKEGRGKLDVYFTRVFNPVWTYPDGFTWIEALTDENKIGCHVALTPTWNETAYYADYVLPMGNAGERHDVISYETHASTWVAFRQPVQREFQRRQGKPVNRTYEANPGEVWEEDEFWIDLSWAVDPDGALGIRRWFESETQPGQPLTVEEYYEYVFQRVPGLPEAAAKENQSPLEYMRRRGVFEVNREQYHRYEKAGFKTPSHKLEIYSETMEQFGWADQAVPDYIESHVHAGKRAPDQMILVPTFRLPTLIHTRSGAAKWLNEISNRNPVWLHTSDARRLGLATGDVIRVETEIGYFIDRVWVTEGIRPGVVACSHHIGRWRREQDPAANQWSANTVSIEKRGDGYFMRVLQGPRPFTSNDPDSSRVFWRDGGVHQNAALAIHTDPASGMNCWHQPVRVMKPKPGDQYGDVFADTAKSFELYKQWLDKCRRSPVQQDGKTLRRPLWLKRPHRPRDEAFYYDTNA